MRPDPAAHNGTGTYFQPDSMLGTTRRSAVLRDPVRPARRTSTFQLGTSARSHPEIAHTAPLHPSRPPFQTPALHSPHKKNVSASGCALQPHKPNDSRSTSVMQKLLNRFGRLCSMMDTPLLIIYDKIGINSWARYGIDGRHRTDPSCVIYFVPIRKAVHIARKAQFAKTGCICRDVSSQIIAC